MNAVPRHGGKGMTMVIVRAWRAIVRIVTRIFSALLRVFIRPRKGKKGKDYQYEIGDLNINYDVRVLNGEVMDGALPETLTCTQVFRILAIHDEPVRDCKGYGGPWDSNNTMLREALKEGMKAARKIDCPKEDCPERDITEIFRGWSCRNVNPGSLYATGAVELEVRCLVTQ